MTSGKLRRLTRARLVSLTYTHPWTHSAKGLYASWWGLGRSFRSVLSSFSFVASSYFCKLCSSICHLGLQTTSHAFANCVHDFILQTIILPLYLVYLSSIFLQTIILQTLILQIMLSLFIIVDTEFCLSSICVPDPENSKNINFLLWDYENFSSLFIFFLLLPCYLELCKEKGQEADLHKIETNLSR